MITQIYNIHYDVGQIVMPYNYDSVDYLKKMLDKNMKWIEVMKTIYHLSTIL